MALIQIELPDEVDKKVGIYKIVNNLKTKEDAVVKMLEELKFDIKVTK
jgi:hypothetical protein